jgi:hypothetical protein
MGIMVAWLVLADGVALAMRRRPSGDRATAWLGIASLVVLAGWIAWGLAIPSRHGGVAAERPAVTLRREDGP